MTNSKLTNESVLVVFLRFIVFQHSCGWLFATCELVQLLAPSRMAFASVVGLRKGKKALF